MWRAMNPVTGALSGEDDLKTHGHLSRRDGLVETKAHISLMQL